jgi:hypothetical protein
VAGKRRGKLSQTKITVSIPDLLIEKIEQILRVDGSWGTSVADFLRQAAAEKVRQLDPDRRSSPVDIEALGDPMKAVRR